jgi:hypothetical protein
MIISHKFKFIFIKTKKTAGTSIEVFLSPLCGPNDVLTQIVNEVKPHIARNYGKFINHSSASEVRESIGPIWNEYFKFCVERNPWDKTISYYYFKKYRFNLNISFDEFLKHPEYYSTNYPLYVDENGKIIVDCILRYEKLSIELTDIFKKLGVPFNGDLDVYAKSEYRTDHRPYREIYTEVQRKIVEKVFEWEIKTFGYVF